MIRGFLLLVTATLSFQGFAQLGDAILEGFTVQQLGNVIRADFAIQGGASCLGAELQRYRADAGPDFLVVDRIREVCGGTEFVEHYTLIDEAPLNGGASTYRLQLGGIGYTRTLEVEFVPFFDAMVIFPNPAGEKVRVRWDALPGQRWLLRIHDAKGRILLHEEVVGNTQVFDVSPLSEGLYFLSIEDEAGSIVTRKWMKSR